MEVTGLECSKVSVGEKIPVKKKSLLKAMLSLTQGLSKYKMIRRQSIVMNIPILC